MRGEKQQKKKKMKKGRLQEIEEEEDSEDEESEEEEEEGCSHRMTAEMEEKVKVYKSLMAELQKRFDQEREIEVRKRQEQARRFQAGFEIGKNWQEMQIEQENRDIERHLKESSELIRKQDEVRLKLQELVREVCPGCVFKNADEHWQWLTTEQQYQRFIQKGRSKGKGKSEQQKEMPEEEAEDEGPRVMYIGGGVRIVEKEKGSGAEQAVEGKGS